MKILVLPGDGIGEEITRATMTVLEVVDTRFSLGLEYDFMDIGFKALEKTGTTLPDPVLEAAKNPTASFSAPFLISITRPGIRVGSMFRLPSGWVSICMQISARPGPGRGCPNSEKRSTWSLCVNAPKDFMGIATWWPEPDT